MTKQLKIIAMCSSLILMACSEDAPPAAPAGDAASTDAVTAEQAAQPQPSKAEEPQGDAGTSESTNSASAVVDDNPIPTEAECKDALVSMTNFAEKIGQKPPKKKERKEFLIQCENWPRTAVQCLVKAEEAGDVLECMKPISRMEMKRSIEEAKKTVPGVGSKSGNKMLAPKKVKDRGGAAARRMESFKKAVGKD